MLLKDIRSSQDLKNLGEVELKDLAAQLRHCIIEQVARKGGHLAPSLGVIELTIALHKVFNTPEDILVWDVGHQAYAHKLLTGRYESFHTLRQHGGISGFLKRKESPYDAFGAGHASTSISAALGFAVARDQLQQKHSVVAVIGDGSMTGGMAFEALNNAAAARENITIVLNDNKMSIAPNVGAVSKYLNRVISDPSYNKVRDDVMRAAEKFPIRSVGPKLRDLAGTVLDTAKRALLPGRLFEDLGIRYFGPIDGHDLGALTDILSRVKNIPGPCLVHVLTEKGRGWSLSEKDAYKWHASVPFDTESGQPLVKEEELPSLTSVFGQALLELARQDKRIVGITGAMPSGCGLNIVEKELPHQVFDVGIAESHGVTFAAGLACGGLIPVCAIYSTFLQRAFDQIIHDVALQHLHVVFALDRAGLVGADGPTHHGTFDLSYLRMIPDLVLMAPSDQDELRDMLYTAIQYKKGPVAFRFPRGNAKTKPKTGFDILPLGKFRVLQEGSEILLVGVGHMVHELKKTAELLAEQGVSSTLVDARFIKPLDIESYVDLISRHAMVITLEDNSIIGGFGSAIAELLHEHGLGHVTLLRMGLPDSFVDHGDVGRLYQELGIDGLSVAKKILETRLVHKE